MDTFTVSAVDLGLLTKVKVRQDDSGGSSAWHCSHVEVQREGGDARVFPCGKWLATGEENKLRFRLLGLGNCVVKCREIRDGPTMSLF